MPVLSWNEIRMRAVDFSREWAGAREERAEAQTFWNEFFHVFGIRRRTVATFEEPVKSLKNTYHRIDLFWKGRLLAEHKSAGEDLDKAKSQAFQYIQELVASGRQDEVPRYILLSDFNRMVLYDLEPEEGDPEHVSFNLIDLHAHLGHFAFFIGQKVHRFGEEDEANLKAAAIMADLHDAVSEGHYDAKSLERLLVRLLFCLFADDTGIFESAQFECFILNCTRENGSDLGAQLNALFDVLNTPREKRPSYLDDDLSVFPYVNGELFKESLPVAGFSATMRNAIITACRFDWSRISPAIFGSLFQGIMDAKERRQIGAHYTSERDIMKVIRPLFLDALREEFEQIQKDSRKSHRQNRLMALRQKLTTLRFLDPACGCGNFLVIAYRELRRLEHDILHELYLFSLHGEELDLGEEGRVSRVDVDQFFGIEMGEWPARIAETALWLTDHQMNLELSKASGHLFQRIPLRAAPHIRCANALRFDWNDLLPSKECSYVLGNPPFVGAKFQTASQKVDVKLVVGDEDHAGLLDYVAMWYFLAARYIRGTRVRCAFVSTNSISQGEQVGVLWSKLYSQGVKIHFAHRTFAWQSEAKGKAHVHVIIIGFGLGNVEKKLIYEYEDIKGEPKAIEVFNIAPYLVEGGDITIRNRMKPLCDVPEIGIGNKPIDGGNYLFDEEEKAAFLEREPNAEKYFRPWIGSVEFLHGYHRWCLWLGDASPKELREMPECRKRIQAVKRYRMMSKSYPTRRLAETPERFHVENFPESSFLVLPEVSSEKRKYIPIGYLSPPVICSNLVKIMHDATLYHFGTLTSAMHMAWVRQVCGRLKSDFRYSAKLVYNNYPWPLEATEAKRARVEACAQKVLDVRQRYLDTGNTLADLYDAVCMPAVLVKAHIALDRAVDRCYRREPFPSDRERVEYLFGLYESLTAPLAPSAPAKKSRRKKQVIAFIFSSPAPRPSRPRRGLRRHHPGGRPQGARLGAGKAWRGPRCRVRLHRDRARAWPRPARRPAPPLPG